MVLTKGQWCSEAGKVTVGLVESNGKQIYHQVDRWDQLLLMMRTLTVPSYDTIPASR